MVSKGSLLEHWNGYDAGKDLERQFKSGVKEKFG
jgi:hypothetical protein